MSSNSTVEEAAIPLYIQLNSIFEQNIQQLRKDRCTNTPYLFEKVQHWCMVLEKTQESARADIDLLKKNPANAGMKECQQWEYYYLIPFTDLRDGSLHYNHEIDGIPIDPASLEQVTCGGSVSIFNLNGKQLSAVQTLLTKRNSETKELGKWVISRIGALKGTGAFGIVIKLDNARK
ncbi:hypothetical protein RUND412_007391 [Rhizina undulata]